MLNFDRILIIGDSFCANRESESDWTAQLGKILGVTVDGKGFGGQSWWACNNYLHKFKSANENNNKTLLIVLHTFSGRLPNDFDLPITPSVMRITPNTANDELEFAEKENPGLRNLASEFYQSKLFSIDFYEWAHRSWIKEVDQDSGFLFTIHVPVFDNLEINVKNGIVLKPSAKLDCFRKLSDAEIDDVEWFGRDTRRNHFNQHNNIKLAEAFANIITQLDQDSRGIHYFNNLDQWDLKKDFISRISNLDKYRFKGSRK